VNRDFYSTMAQVLPVLLLALVLDSTYLDRLRTRTRVSRRIDPDGVRFWTKPRVRVYSILVAIVLIAAIAGSLLVLADLLGDSDWLRITLSCALGISLGTLLVRIISAVIDATDA
jgi:hypothetical protein